MHKAGAKNGFFGETAKFFCVVKLVDWWVGELGCAAWV
jgi:hypothetical protein